MHRGLLLVDFHNLLYKAVSVNEYLSHGDTHTGGLYGFVNQICSNILKFKPSHIIVCCDLPPYFRNADYPEYKQQRERQRDEVRGAKIAESREYIREFLDILNIPVWQEKGFEADDLMAIACQTYAKEFQQIFCISNDDDLFQLFEHGDNIRLVAGKNLFSSQDYKRQYGDISFPNFIKMFAMSGTHNGIPGIKGIGPVNALKLIRDPSAYRKVYNDNRELLDLFEKIVRLPYQPVACHPLASHHYNSRSMIRFMNRFNINITPSMDKAFDFLADGGDIPAAAKKKSTFF